MLRGYESYSFKHGKKRTKKLLSFLLKFFIALFILYLIVTNVFITSHRVATDSMAPNIVLNERVLASPVVYGIRFPFSQKRVIETGRPRRGDVVIIEPPYLKNEGLLKRIFNPLVHFFSLQGRSLFPDRMTRGAGKHVIKRVVGVPGDTVVVKDLVVYIKPVNQARFQRESDLIPVGYAIGTDGFKENWPKGLPFSGDMGEITLDEKDYFVLGDNRGHSSDSRSWGPVPFERIIGKIVLRYWPLDKLGIP
jgi:signal peptidase I